MDAELRELSRRAQAGDAAARERLLSALLRARRPDAEAWAGVGFRPHPDLFARAEGLTPPVAEQVVADLAALDPRRLRAHFPRQRDGQPCALAGLALYGESSARLALFAAAGPDGLAIGLGAAGTFAPRWAWDARVGPALTRVAADPAGGARVLADADGAVWEDRGGERRALERGPAPVLALRAAAGQTAWVTPEAVCLRQGQAPARALPLPLPGAIAAALDPALTLAAVSDGTALAVLELERGRVLWRLRDARHAEQTEVRALLGLDFSPDGQQLAQASGAVLVRGARDGRLVGQPVLPERATREVEDNESTMGLARGGSLYETWPDARDVRWMSANRLATLGSRLRVWTLGPHARQGPTRTSYGEDASSREWEHHTSDASAPGVSALLDVGGGRILALDGAGTPQLLEAGRLGRLWTGPSGGPAVLAGARDRSRVVLGCADGSLAVHELPRA